MKHIKEKRVFSGMIFSRFTRWALGVIFVFLALKYSLACAQKGILKKGNWSPRASSPNDPRGDISAAMTAEVAGLKGLSTRKMKACGSLKKEIKENQVPMKERPNQSGKGDSKEQFEGAAAECLKHQGSSRMHQRLNQNPTTGYFDPGYPVFHEKQRQRYKKDDMKAFSKEADDVANVMRRDYGRDKPHKKPPIHNK